MNNRKKAIVVGVALAVIVGLFLYFVIRTVFFATTQGITYYVAATGSDSNTGTIGSPFATVTKARDTIRAAAQTGVTVYIRGGEYDLTAPITFTASDSGTATAPNIYTNYPGESPIFKASKAIKTVAGDTGKKTYTLNTTDFPNIAATGVPELFFNGTRQDIARTPNNLTPDFTATDPFAGYFLQATTSQPDCTSSSGVGNIIYFDNTKLDTTGWDLTNYPVSVKVWTGANSGAYNSIIRPVASIDQANGKIMIGTINSSGTYVPTYTNHNICVGDNFYIQGEPHMIDKAGEYAYDTSTKQLTINLPSTLTSTDKISIPYFAGPAFSVSGASYLQFHGLTINEVDGDGLFITGSNNIIADALTVSGVIGNGRDNSLGSPTPSGIEGDGIGVASSDSITIQNSTIHDAPVNRGISLLSTDTRIKNLTLSKDQILNNEIYDTGYQGAIGGDEYGVTIKNNYLHDLPGGGIRGNLTLDEIAYNRIENTSSNVCDNGAIYTWAGGSFIMARNNKVHDNFISNTGGYCHAPGTLQFNYHASTWGIYFDNVSSYNQTYNNIIVDAVGCVELNYGWGNSVKNNMCITNQGLNGDGLALNSDMGPFYTKAYDTVQMVLGGNGYNTSAYTTAFPDLTTLPSTWDIANAAKGLTIENNVIVGNLNYGADWKTGRSAIYFRTINTVSPTIVNNNLYYDPSSTPVFKGGNYVPLSGTYDYNTYDLTGWQSHSLDKIGKVADPLFVQSSILTNSIHPFTDSFALQSSSPAIALGFTNIDQSKIGLLTVSSPVTPVVTTSITSPNSGSTVSNTVSVATSATTTSGNITNITVSLDSNVIGTGSTSPYTASFDSTKYSNGAHTIKVTATDSNGISATASEPLTISNTNTSTTPTIHVNSLTGSAKQSGSNWTARITVSDADNTGALVTGATITGTWSGGLSGTSSCTISSTSTSCTIGNNKVNLANSVTFTITNITASGYTYNASDNKLSSVTVQPPTSSSTGSTGSTSSKGPKK